MQNRSVKKVFFLTFMPAILVLALFLTFFGVSKNLITYAAESAISVKLVTVSDEVPEDYTPKLESPTIIDTDAGSTAISYTEGSDDIPFVLLDNTYHELTTPYSLTKTGTGAVTGFTYNGASYLLDENHKSTETIDGYYYFYDQESGKILRCEGKHQALYISLGNENTVYRHLQITLKLNGNEILNNAVAENVDFQYYNQIIHGLSQTFVKNANLSSYFYTQDKKGNLIDEVEGLYEISITYFPTASSQSTTATFKFYLITSSSYTNDEDSIRFDNTQKISTNEDTSTYATEHYFNQTNKNTTTRDEQTVESNTLLFPTISYNPEKYIVSYKRTLHSYVETGSFTFKEVDGNDMMGQITETIKKDDVEIGSTTKYIARQTDELEGDYVINKTNGTFASVTLGAVTYAKDSNNLVEIDGNTYYYNSVDDTICLYDNTASFCMEWTFEKLGNYEFYKNCLIKTSYNNYVTATGIVLSDKNLLKTEALYMNGFQATYSKGDSGTDYLRNDTFKSDFTFLNDDVINADSLILEPTADEITIKDDMLSISSKTIFEITNSIMPSTNQPPVKLEYNATLNTTANTNWFIYVDNYGNKSVKSYTYSTVFSDAGTYYVYLSFKNNASSQTSYSQQIIAFKIDNTTPEIVAVTTDQKYGASPVKLCSVL